MLNGFHTTLFLATRGGGFSWVAMHLVLASKISNASSAVIGYGFETVTMDDLGAAQFPSLARVERRIHVDSYRFWIEAVDLSTGQRDATVEVPIQTLRQAAFAREQVIYLLGASEGAMRNYVEPMSSAERDCLFGCDVSDRLALDFHLPMKEPTHGTNSRRSHSSVA